jgi:hypothetical protein
MVPHHVEDITTHTSFLEMLDALSERPTRVGEHPIAFGSDCREGSASPVVW